MNTALTEEIGSIILTIWPGRFEAGSLQPEVILGEGGLGLDSVEIAELLIACEDQLGARIEEDLLEFQPLTISALAVRCARPVT